MDSDDLERETSECEQAGNSTKLDLLRLQLKIIRFFGVFPPEEGTWKHSLFVTISTVYISLYFPQMYAMVAAAYEYWGNIDMVTKILFQITTAVEAGILTSYFIVRRKKLALLFDMMETNFIPHIEKVVTPENKRRIIKEASKRSVTITYILMFIFSSVILGWICLPLIRKYNDASVQADIQVMSENAWNYYCYILWLPKEMVSGPFMYEIIYLCQVLTIYVVVGHYTGCNVILFFFMFHISTHLKLLASSFEDMRKVYEMESGENEEKTHTQTGFRIFMSPTIYNYFMYDSGPIVPNFGENAAHVEGDKPRFLNANKNPENIRLLQPRSNGDMMTQSQTSERQNVDISTQTASIEEKMNLHFINCIKYHQEILT